MNQAELENFYLTFVESLRARGVLCGITSGLACVHFGVSESTQDCDLLCFPDGFGKLLELLSETRIDGLVCRYRGNISPPLDERWHHGGWTSHFVWGHGPEEVTFDVFGQALRSSTRWQSELSDLYVSRHVVAEMKRTNRDKDWPVINALGAKLLQAGDQRGWLHIFEEDTLLHMLEAYPCPAEISVLRPALRMAAVRDTRTAGALNAERKLWEELDRVRIRIYEGALRPYVVAVRKAQLPEETSLFKQHEVRVGIASQCLASQPLNDYGIARHIEEARQSLVLSGRIPAEALDWLPDVRTNFSYLQT